MTNHRLPYADADTPPQMAVDAHEVGHNLRLEHRLVESHRTDFLGDEPAGRDATHYEVSDDLARMADGLELHFD